VLQKQVDLRFKKVMKAAVVTGVLTNLYIFGLVCFFNGGIEMLSPVIGGVIFGILFFLFKNDRFSAKSIFFISSITVIIEVVFHSWFFGVTCGFYYFIFLIPIIFLVNSTWKKSFSVIFILLSLTSIVYIWLAFEKTPTKLDIDEGFQGYISLLNALSSGIVVIILIFYFRKDVDIKDQELMEKNAELLIQNSQQEVLLKEIHHRVKNNLQVISSLISLQRNAVNDPTALNALEESKRRIEAIALIHQKLYQDKRVNKVDFNSYLNELMQSQQKINSNINCIVNCPDHIELNLDVAMPLGIILSELISNSLKHAFLDVKSPVITILVFGAEPNYRIEFKDNGSGLPPEFNFQTCESLGMEIISALIAQIEAAIIAKNDNGAYFEITFKNLV
jgi:two-component sensor histidine kinase